MNEKEKDIVARGRTAAQVAMNRELLNCLCDEIEGLRLKLEASQAALGEYMSSDTDEIERLRAMLDELLPKQHWDEKLLTSSTHLWINGVLYIRETENAPEEWGKEGASE